jgi:hypothetical protein
MFKLYGYEYVDENTKQLKQKNGILSNIFNQAENLHESVNALKMISNTV